MVVVVSPLISLIAEDQTKELRRLAFSAVNISNPEVGKLRTKRASIR